MIFKTSTVTADEDGGQKRKKIAEHMDSIRKKTAGKNINMAKEIIEWRKKQ